MRYRLRTLLIVLALGPIILAGAWFGYDEYRIQQLLRESDGRTHVFVSRYVELHPDEDLTELDRLYESLSTSER